MGTGNSRGKSLKNTITRYLSCLISRRDKEANNKTNVETRLSALPIDLKFIILGKLDLTTLYNLYHCSVALSDEINPLLPRITTLSGALPPSSVKDNRFIRTLVGLESLELEVPFSAFTDEIYLPCPRLWFRWFFKLGINAANNHRYAYMVMVVGSIPDRLDDDDQSILVAVRHMESLLLWTSNLFGNPVNEHFTNLRKLVIKDTAKIGRLEVDDGVDFMACLEKVRKSLGGEASGMAYFVPVCMVATFRNNNGEPEVLASDKTFLVFHRWEEDVHQDNGGDASGGGGGDSSSSSRPPPPRRSVDELVSDCIGCLKPERENEDDVPEKRDLGYCVKRILEHNRRLLFQHWPLWNEGDTPSNKDYETRLSSFPIDLKAIILSKLDITTLYKCAVALPDEISPVLPRITYDPFRCVALDKQGIYLALINMHGGIHYGVPTMMSVSCKDKNETLQFQQSILHFYKWEEVVRQDNNGDDASSGSSSSSSRRRSNHRHIMSVDDLERDCVGYLEADDEKTELREVVRRIILTHDSRKLLDHI